VGPDAKTASLALIDSAAEYCWARCAMEPKNFLTIDSYLHQLHNSKN